LSAKDVQTRGPSSFSAYDTNKDNFVSEDEFYNLRAIKMQQRANDGRRMRKAGNAPSFEFFDTNSDGKLDKLELLEGQNKQMRKNKANKRRGNR